MLAPRAVLDEAHHQAFGLRRGDDDGRDLALTEPRAGLQP
jgi:hypothetical protein